MAIEGDAVGVWSAVRMDLDLVHRRHHGGLGKQALEVLGHEVADADGPHLAAGKQLLQRPVGIVA